MDVTFDNNDRCPYYSRRKLVTLQGKKNGSVKTAKPFEQKKAQVESTDNLENQYDLIVVGTDPEGVSAAVSAARNGQKTLLIDGKEREVLGGLMTIGWLNSLDMNYARGGKAAAGKNLKF
ncbi:FAD-dependent oxidoreductase [Paenibacillus larvae]|uniref:FAD-dependent oxidoreductase n=1 Tax=Paenibacillus larvae TaxID=1464 RepID=UPI00288F94EC|nr:FAD-dependent oxidoreductase [Paenibacillus larvae]MDT2194439.1 FAD-dependent oxidoreductase [Paenibacillus larvae]MDT2236961.1 FAD-dependent oxidoreductase [Paenibacillus larvae]MDT2254864.1 FAD-dependent oxidoreductase [Paenibacillus larvae]MDT2264267.1 FAD-dependent oxidoreductase [Paenibacillus larvae]MDT2276548.1 FAD-dependent oxidoreductase [Paenibacillus larvae]